jgi:hypothetical protein
MFFWQKGTNYRTGASTVWSSKIYSNTGKPDDGLAVEEIDVGVRPNIAGHKASAKSSSTPKRFWRITWAKVLIPDSWRVLAKSG